MKINNLKTADLKYEIVLGENFITNYSQINIFIILLSFFLTSCNWQDRGKNKLTNKTLNTNMTDKKFESTIEKIRTSDIYENPNNWEACGLNPSDQSVILILRKAKNDFLEKLEKIPNSKESSETKLK